MIMTDKYIAPDEIRVGFNKRADTLSGLLGFMIYRNRPDGSYGQEKSFNGWKDASVKEKMINNKFQDGFVINKGHKRFHYYGNTVKIRVYHPEGFEFEIPLDNLALILHNCTVDKSNILDKCIVAWDKNNVYLIPEVLKNEVTIKEMNAAQKKFSERKFIPASKCEFAKLYQTENGVEFNLGKLNAFKITRLNDEFNNVITFESDLAAQASIPASYFEDAVEKPFTSLPNLLLKTKKIKEMDDTPAKKSFIQKNGDFSVHRYMRHNEVSTSALYNPSRSIVILNKEIKSDDTFSETNSKKNIYELIWEASCLVEKGQSLINKIVIPKKVTMKGKSYYFLLLNNRQGDLFFNHLISDYQKRYEMTEEINKPYSRLYMESRMYWVCRLNIALIPVGDLDKNHLNFNKVKVLSEIQLSLKTKDNKIIYSDVSDKNNRVIDKLFELFKIECN